MRGKSEQIEPQLPRGQGNHIAKQNVRSSNTASSQRHVTEAASKQGRERTSECRQAHTDAVCTAAPLELVSRVIFTPSTRMILYPYVASPSAMPPPPMTSVHTGTSTLALTAKVVHTL